MYKIIHTTNSKYSSHLYKIDREKEKEKDSEKENERDDLHWETIYDPNAVHSLNGKHKGKYKNIDSMDSNDKEDILHEKCLIKSIPKQ
jgi:hypothetical protein